MRSESDEQGNDPQNYIQFYLFITDSISTIQISDADEPSVGNGRATVATALCDGFVLRKIQNDSFRSNFPRKGKIRPRSRRENGFAFRFASLSFAAGCFAEFLKVSNSGWIYLNVIELQFT